MDVVVLLPGRDGVRGRHDGSLVPRSGFRVRVTGRMVGVFSRGERARGGWCGWSLPGHCRPHTFIFLDLLPSTSGVEEVVELWLCHPHSPPTPQHRK